MGQAERLRERRHALIQAFGGHCERCGTDDERVLQIDHVNGRLKEERGRQPNYADVIYSIEHGLRKYQLLCANCNWIKRVENNDVPNSAGQRQGGFGPMVSCKCGCGSDFHQFDDYGRERMVMRGHHMRIVKALFKSYSRSVEEYLKHKGDLE